MLNKFTHKLASPFRRFLGIEAVLQNQRQILNALSIETRSQAYFGALDLIHLLTPMDLQGATYVRLGRDHDGGYVLVSDLLEEVNIAYSFGVANDMSWEEAIAERDIDVFLFDHTIETPRISDPRLRFRRIGITGAQQIEECRTLDGLLEENGHQNRTDLVLKLDVEGCEWDALEQCTSQTLSQFSQIVIEYHGLHPWLSTRRRETLAKLNATHQCVHVHAARSVHPGTTPFVSEGVILPKQLEVTYVRRRDVEGRLVPNQRKFPTNLDMPGSPEIADVDLGFFTPCPPREEG